MKLTLGPGPQPGRQPAALQLRRTVTLSDMKSVSLEKERFNYIINLHN